MKQISTFTANDVSVKKRERVFDGFFKVDKYSFEHAKFDGGTSTLIEREIFERGDAVAVLPYDPTSRTVLLVEQVRIGALKTKENPWLLECIAGMNDGSTDYESVARREAYEEAGIELTQLEFMLSYLSSPGGTTERLYLYLAHADLSQAGGVYGLDEEGEDIKVHVIPVDDALARLQSGEIDNAATVISLQWLALNEPRLQQEYKSSK